MHRVGIEFWKIDRLITRSELTSFGASPVYIKALYRGRVAQRGRLRGARRVCYAQFGRKDGGDSSTLWPGVPRTVWGWMPRI
jgi:hypothetical protein